MPLYKIEVFKTLGPGRKEWANVYHGFCASLDDAGRLADEIVDVEQANHQDYVTILRARVANPALPGTDFRILGYNFAGALTGFGNALPMWNTVRLDFSVPGGRPSRKFYRFPLTETDQDGGALVSGALSRLTTDLTVPFNAIIATPPVDCLLTDESGNTFDGCSVWPFVQMRQTYRRRRASGGSGPPVA